MKFVVAGILPVKEHLGIGSSKDIVLKTQQGLELGVHIHDMSAMIQGNHAIVHIPQNALV